MNQDMSPQDWDDLEAGFLKFVEEERQEPEHAEDEAVFAAGLALITPDKKALFLKRSDKGDHAGEWCFPGGKIDGDESPEEAAIREIREETQWIAPEDSERPQKATTQDGFVTFKQRVLSEFIPTLDDEHTGYAWAPMDDPPQPLHPGVAATIEQIAQDNIPALVTNANSGIPAGLTTKEGEDAEPIAINKSFQVQWMSIMSVDGRRMYADETLPEQIINNGKPLNPLNPLFEHETKEFAEMRRQIEAFKQQYGREPNDEERKKIYLSAHYKSGTKAEEAWLTANDYSVPEWMAWCRGKLSELENRQITNPPPDPDVKPFEHKHGEIETAVDGAMDAKWEEFGDSFILAFDRDTVRQFDRDGRLKVSLTPISKANVCPYFGYEIPRFEELGLQPDRIYQLLRDPDELAKAAHTFNNIPLLEEHVPISADEHDPEIVLGATGSNAVFRAPYLLNSLGVWTRKGIDGIESNKKRELSSAYHYDADMTPGVYMGARYDGVMRNIIGNHVALVEEGRAGSDVLVADSKLSYKKAWYIIGDAVSSLAA